MRMFDVASSLENAISRARIDLAADASVTSRAQTSYGGSRTDAAMAAVARSAIFTEVLLNAVHARLAEIKNVTRG